MDLSNIKTVGVVGAGTMGQGIAISCVMAGYDTILFDVNTEVCDKALQLIQQTLDQSVAKGKLHQSASDDTFKRIRKVSPLSELKVDLIIEAVV